MSDTRNRGDRVLDLGREYVFTTGNDHVFFPVHDKEVSVGIQVANIPGVEPAIAQRSGTLGLVLPVALRHTRATCHYFSQLVPWHIMSCIVDHADVYAPAGAPGGTKPRGIGAV